MAGRFQFKIFLRILPLWVLLSSCAQKYVSPIVNVPLLSDGAETQFSLNMGTNGYCASVATAPVNHWAIIGAGSVLTGVAPTDHAYDMKQISGEVGTGTFFRISRTGRIELFGGIGEVSSGNNIERWITRRFFIQPNAGISSPNFDVGISPRITFANHYLTRQGNTEIKVGNDRAVFFEPSLMVRAGKDAFKFQFQGGLCYSFSGKNIPIVKNSRNSFFYLGMHFTLFKDFERYN